MIPSVLDANALAAGAAGFRIQHGAPGQMPGQILRAWRAGQFELITSDHILAEVQRMLDKRYFQARLTSAQVTQFLAMLAREATVVPLTVTVAGVATHPEDDLVLATAVSAQAEYLVTGDRQLLRLGSYRGVTILSPRDFLTVLGIR
jgi:putative PIN family toxin of toxin-antitoxin system